MSVMLLKDIVLLLPKDEDEINTSLLMTKYGHVKTGVEKEMSFGHVKRAVSGKAKPQKKWFGALPGQQSVFMKLEAQLIVDSGGGTTEHAGLCIHPHFGVPMIPGSAVKGVTRHLLWIKWRDAVESEEKDKAKDFAKELVDVFGYPTGDDGKIKEGKKTIVRTPNLDHWCQENIPELVLDSNKKAEALAGKIVFLPAMPIGSAQLDVDVLTCHHMEYYSPTKEKTHATDDESPNPQFFPVVKKGATFEFAVRPTLRGTDAMVQRALILIQEALELNGIGSKTSAGYGWFSIDEELTKKRKDEEREAELEKKCKDYLKDYQELKNSLLEESDFSQVVGRILESGSDDEKSVLIALLLTEKASYLRNQRTKANKNEKGPQSRVIAINKLLEELKGIFE